MRLRTSLAWLAPALLAMGAFAAACGGKDESASRCDGGACPAVDATTRAEAGSDARSASDALADVTAADVTDASEVDTSPPHGGACGGGNPDGPNPPDCGPGEVNAFNVDCRYCCMQTGQACDVDASQETTTTNPCCSGSCSEGGVCACGGLLAPCASSKDCCSGFSCGADSQCLDGGA